MPSDCEGMIENARRTFDPFGAMLSRRFN